MSRRKRIEQLEALVECLREQVEHLQQYVADLDTEEVPCGICGHRTTGHVCLYCENLTLQVKLEEAQIELQARRVWDAGPARELTVGIEL